MGRRGRCSEASTPRLPGVLGIQHFWPEKRIFPSFLSQWRVFMRDGRRGALCRHGPFRPQADSAGLVDARLPEPRPQLCWPSGARSRRCSHSGQHLLSAMSTIHARAAGAAGDNRHDHRQPVHHHRRLLDDAAGDPARMAAAPADRADVRTRIRSDLCRRRQLAIDDRDARSDDRLRQVGQFGSGLRHRGLGHDAGRLDEHPEKMRQRRETVEHPFGTIKARMGATHFLMKTLFESCPKLRGELLGCRTLANEKMVNRVGGHEFGVTLWQV